MDSFNPLVTILIPVYNGSNYIQTAIESALSQTYKSIEIVVVNDGSTDNGKTREICEKYKDKIHYFEKQNGGCASALNFGIANSNGDYISWLSHDDVYSNDKIEFQIQQIRELGLSNKTIHCCSGDRIDASGDHLHYTKIKDNRLFNPDEAFSYLFLKKPFNSLGALFPRRAFLNSGFDVDYVYILDWKKMIDLSLNGYSFYLSSEVKCSTRIHDKRVTTKYKKKYYEETTKCFLQYVYLLKEINSIEKIRDIYYFAEINDNKVLSSACKQLLKNQPIKIDRMFIVRKKIFKIIKTIAKAVVK